MGVRGVGGGGGGCEAADGVLVGLGHRGVEGFEEDGEAEVQRGFLSGIMSSKIKLTSALVQTHGASSRRPRRCSGGPPRWPSERPKSLHGVQWRTIKRTQRRGASRIAQETKPSPATATAGTQPQLLTFMGAWLVTCPPTNALTFRTPTAHSSVTNTIPEAAPFLAEPSSNSPGHDPGPCPRPFNSEAKMTLMPTGSPARCRSASCTNALRACHASIPSPRVPEERNAKQSQCSPSMQQPQACT